MLGEALKYLREAAGLSLTRLATELGLSKAYVSEIENDKKTPTLEVLNKYSRYFGIPASYIMFFAEEESDSNLMSNRLRKMLGKAIIATVKRQDK